MLHMPLLFTSLLPFSWERWTAAYYRSPQRKFLCRVSFHHLRRIWQMCVKPGSYGEYHLNDNTVVSVLSYTDFTMTLLSMILVWEDISASPLFFQLPNVIFTSLFLAEDPYTVNSFPLRVRHCTNNSKSPISVFTQNSEKKSCFSFIFKDTFPSTRWRHFRLSVWDCLTRFPDPNDSLRHTPFYKFIELFTTTHTIQHSDESIYTEIFARWFFAYSCWRYTIGIQK